MRCAIGLGLMVVGSCHREAQTIAARPELPLVTHGTVAPRPEPPAVVIHAADGSPVVVHVEIARTEPVRERGLMFRQNMDEDHGMIFVFTHPEHQTFWMHNTILPLDMLFIRDDLTVLGIVKNATPETDAPREVPGDSLYVLEVNGGFADRHRVVAGNRIDMVGIPAAIE